MFDFIRRLKLSYCAYNFFHKNELVHNINAYKKLGLRKKYYSTVSSKTFEHLPANQQAANSIQAHNTDFLASLSAESRQSVNDFNDNGYE